MTAPAAPARYVVAPDQPETGCVHLEGLRPLDPEPPEGCEDCLRDGTEWVHLRQCLNCGHVGCCDSSPQQHATKHFAATGHPVMASAAARGGLGLVLRR